MVSDPVVLVTGAGGQVGQALRSVLAAATFLTHAQLDVTERDQVESATADIDVVVHLAALTNVDLCERQPDLAYDVNSEGTRLVAEAVRGRARLIYVSTDYVFDGNKTGAYEESDKPGPINHYGRSKLEGEFHVLKERRNLVIRTSWVYGQGSNFVTAILSRARRGDELRVVGDQRGRPTHARDLAVAIAALVRSPCSDILHFAGGGAACNRAEWAQACVEMAGVDAAVHVVDSDAYANESSEPVAPRPKNTVLALRRANELGLHVRDWRQSLQEYLETQP